MQVLLVLGLLMAGMRVVTWDDALVSDTSARGDGTQEVFASDGPFNPPPPRP